MPALLTLFAATGAPAQTPKRLLAYYFFGSQNETPKYSAALIPYQKLTHIAHVVVQPAPDASGAVKISDGALEPLLITKAHAAGTKVMACVQGPAQLFSKVASNEATRTKFARSLREFIDQYNYDGVDIDWEVPEGATDVANCTLLMRALRDAMPTPKYLLSMATPSVPGHWGEFDFKGLTPQVDFFNVMTYDFHGPWTEHTGHNSPLYATDADTGHEGSLHDSISLYLNQLAVPPEKINLGTAFYGYEFPASGFSAECKCSKTTRSAKYSAIKPRVNHDGWTRKFDPIAMAPYLVHDAAPAGLITYDDPQSTARKVTYALETRDLGGVFMWEISGDYDGSSQELMDAMYNAFIRAKPAGK